MSSYEEWLKRARSSLELAKYSDNELIYYEDLCFQIPQAVEKEEYEQSIIIAEKCLSWIDEKIK
jgi:hypothetical protein